MDIRRVIVAVAILAGVVLVGYGLYVGDEGRVSVEVTEAVPEAELRDDLPVREYDYLTPAIQDAFRESLDSGESVRVDRAPEPSVAYVHYRDAYYRMATEWADAVQTTMFFSITGGIGLILVGSLAWAFLWRGTRNDGP